MNRLTRLLASSSVVLLAALGAVQAAQQPLGLRLVSGTGNFLAGQAALVDLRTEEAATYFSAAAESDWDNPLMVERAFLALAADGQIARASVVAQHMLDLDDSSDLARLIVATEAIKQRRYAAASTQLKDLVGDNFAGITGVILRSWADVGDGHVDTAFGELDKLGRDGLDDFLVFHRALMAEVSGRGAEAIDLARQAYEADPKVARIVEAYARILGNAGKFDEAIAVLDKFAADGGTHPLIDVVRASLEKRQRPGMFASSVQVGAAEMFHGLGVALARDGSTDLSLVLLRLGLYLEPRADVISLVVGQLLDSAGQHEQANAVYDSIPASSPMKPTAVVRVAGNLDALGDRAEALRRLSNIVATRPNDVDAASVYGDLLRSDKQYAAAADAYTAALAIDGGNKPSDWRFYYVRGIAYERDNQWDKAEADFLKALALSPDQPMVLNYLGYSWVDKGLNMKQALEMIEKAVDRVPTDGYIVDSLGWAFYKLGRFDEAVATLEQAVQLLPNDPEINDHLGDAYWQVGRKLEAGFQWNIAASVDKEGAVKERVKGKRAEGPAPLELTE